MGRKRQKDSLTNDTPFKFWSLDFDPGSVSISNPTPWACYLTIGATSKSSTKSFDAIIAPYSSYVCDPGDSREFALFVDNSASPFLAFTLPVVIVFSTGAADVQAPLSSALQTVTATGYDAKVLGIVGSSILAYLGLEETAVGTTVAVDLINAQNWNYGNSQVTINQGGIGDGKPSVLFGGAANGQVLPSDTTIAYLNSHWNPNEGTMSGWIFMTPTNAGSVNVFVMFCIGADSNNVIEFLKSASNTVSVSLKRANNESNNPNVSAAYTGGSWLHFAITWSQSNNRMRWFLNGSQVGSDKTLIGTWTANPLTNLMTQLASQQNAFYYPGYLAKWWLATRELTPAEIANISLLS